MFRVHKIGFLCTIWSQMTIISLFIGFGQRYINFYLRSFTKLFLLYVIRFYQDSIESPNFSFSNGELLFNLSSDLFVELLWHIALRVVFFEKCLKFAFESRDWFMLCENWKRKTLLNPVHREIWTTICISMARKYLITDVFKI